MAEDEAVQAGIRDSLFWRPLVRKARTCYPTFMRIIAFGNLQAHWTKHPETKLALQRWTRAVRLGQWTSTAEIQASFSKAKVLNGERVRFEVSGGDYRLIASFKFKNQIAGKRGKTPGGFGPKAGSTKR